MPLEAPDAGSKGFLYCAEKVWVNTMDVLISLFKLITFLYVAWYGINLIQTAWIHHDPRIILRSIGHATWYAIRLTVKILTIIITITFDVVFIALEIVLVLL